MQIPELECLSVSACRDLINEILSQALPVVVVEGEVSGFSINKDTYVFFDIKDPDTSLHCFMMRRGLVQPIEDGMMVRLVARPHVTAKGQLSLTVEAYELVGEGSLARAFNLLHRKLASEGLFADSRKRELPFAPTCIGLISSGESAAYGDFVKILGERWAGVKIIHRDSVVQGVRAEADLVRAVSDINQMDILPEVLVITRGGGSAEDLAAFNTESVARAISASRIPTIVAVGHEQDISLAELVADKRASTPSNAAELLVPDKHNVLANIKGLQFNLGETLYNKVTQSTKDLQDRSIQLADRMSAVFDDAVTQITSTKAMIEVLNPSAALKRGYAIIRGNLGVVASVNDLSENDTVSLEFHDGTANAIIKEVQ